MPMPKPRASEARDAFLLRCMGDEAMQSEFPDRDQRYAVCNTQWRERDSKMSEFLDFEFEIKAVDDDEPGAFAGYASVFGETDQVRDVVAAGAFKRTLSEHRRKGRMPALLWQHDVHEPVGVWKKMKEDDHGLMVHGQLFVEDIPRARQAHRLLKEGGMSGMSIGYRTVKSAIDEKKKIRTLLDVDLFEVSLVTFPALDSARVNAVKAIKTIREFESFLRDEGGFSHAAAKAIAVGGFKALSEHREDDEDAATKGSELRELLNVLQRNLASLKP